MPEETNLKKFLIENVLHELWHEPKITENSRCSCGRPYYLGTSCDHHNRTFNSRNDMMDLYETINKDKKWIEFIIFSNNNWWLNYGRRYNTVEQEMADYTSCIFCLGDKNYEDRCKMVAEFYGWEEKK